MYASSKILHQINNDYRDEGNRLKSFGPWFIRGVETKTLARAGFYYLGVQDHVKCNFCGVVISGWSRGDNPFIEHMKHAPNCPFLNEDGVYNVPIPNTKHLLLEELALLRNSSEKNVWNSKLEKLSAKRIAATARHPSYADGDERLKSFSGWPSSLKQTPQELSDAGFFYLGVGDEVKCFYCGGCLRNFASSDRALYEHKKHYFDRCKFVQFTYKKAKSQTYKLENRRPIKATNDQIDHLCEFMKQNDDMSNGSLFKDRAAYVKAWKDLTNTLNDLDGAVKDVKGWKEVWRNYKYNQKRKTKHAGERDTTNVPSTSLASDNNTTNKSYESLVESVAPKDEYNMSVLDNNTLVDVGNMMVSHNANSQIDQHLEIKKHNVSSTSLASDNDTTNQNYEVESVASKHEYYLTSFDDNTMVDVGNMIIDVGNMVSYNVNSEFDPQMNAYDELVNYMQVDETSHTTDLINTELMQIQFKIDQLNLEIEKHKLELDTRVKQLDLVQKQKQFEAQWQEIENSKPHKIGN